MLGGILAVLTLAGILYGIHSTSEAMAEGCQMEAEECTRLQDDLAVRKEVLRKNQEYLAKNPEVSPSAKIKVRSNIAMAQLQIETVSNQIEIRNEELKKKGCPPCQM